jgi:UDP-glucose 4-epimerase
VKPGTQSRRFTHIDDTINICYKAWKKNNCKYYTISNKKSYSIISVAKLFRSKIILLPPRLGERYASALSTMTFNNYVNRSYGKIDLKKYIESFIKNHSKSKKN